MYRRWGRRRGGGRGEGGGAGRRRSKVGDVARGNRLK